MDQTRPMLCGKCEVPVEGRIDPNGNETVTCPVCGEHDTLDNAVRQATEYKAREVIDGMFKGIGSGSGSLTIKSAPNPRPRFVMG